MFVDRVIIQAKAGDGGNGCRSFRRESYVPRGGPDGGDGGKGGDIVLFVDPNVNNLVEYKYNPHMRAKHGQHGMGSQCYGKAAVDSVYKVPVGTMVYLVPDGYNAAPAEVSDEFEEAEELDDAPKSPRKKLPDPVKSEFQLVADLVEPNSYYILCEGGRGGRGNMRFKTSTNRAPTEKEEGFPGAEGRYLLELSTIADAGLVGFPNAGKSTLLSSISAAKPKVAPYPFTTLVPHLGIVEMPQYERYTVADIPGLVEGAHEGVGLGHDFLRHVERCPVLLFVLDMAGSEGRDPAEDYALLRSELKMFRSDLSKRPSLIVANKMDLPAAEENLKAFKRRFRKKIIPISAGNKAGLDELKKELLSLLHKQT